MELEGAAAAGGAMTGSIVGGILGSLPRTFKINGQPLNQEQKNKLRKFVSP